MKGFPRAFFVGFFFLSTGTPPGFWDPYLGVLLVGYRPFCCTTLPVAGEETGKKKEEEKKQEGQLYLTDSLGKKNRKVNPKDQKIARGAVENLGRSFRNKP